jgi:hypothetical protein
VIDADLVTDLRRTFAAALAEQEPVKARTALVDAGWLDALELDEAVAVALVFREQGRTLNDAAALDDVIAHRLGVGELTVAHPVAPGMHVVLPAHRDAEQVLWLEPNAAQLVALDAPIDAVEVGGVDPDAGFLGLADRPAGRVVSVDAREWAAALSSGRIALAHQLVAGAHELLAAATTYAADRRQFGVPIGSFQAVKHRLAETLVAVSAADAAVIAAATTNSQLGALAAKALAGRAMELAAKHCMQVFGGIGFTTEHEFHRRFRRGLVLDRLLGDRRALERELGGRLRAGLLADESIVELWQTPRVERL